ncbi:MAG: hypothetical protein ACRCWL_01555, partial [Aeromonas sp.]
QACLTEHEQGRAFPPFFMPPITYSLEAPFPSPRKRWQGDKINVSDQPLSQAQLHQIHYTACDLFYPRSVIAVWKY